MSANFNSHKKFIFLSDNCKITLKKPSPTNMRYSFKFVGERPLARWEDNIRIDLKGIGIDTRN